jgi:hypothetical protein
VTDLHPANHSQHAGGLDGPYGIALGNRSGRLTFGTILFLCLAAGAVYLALAYVPPWMSYRAMQEVIQEESGGGDVSSDDQISDRIMATAKEWGVPITREQIVITRTDGRISISTEWDVPISLFGGRFRQVLHYAPSTVSQ